MLYAVKMTLRWILLAALAGIITITPGTQGACVHQGSQYKNDSTWRPQSCEECSCYGDVAVCTPARCPNPQCDFKRGEKLRIPPSRCCPECLAPSSEACQHEGALYGDGSQWSVSPCSVCVCSLGRVSCSPPPCPPLSCPAGQSPFTPAGECCPKCASHGASCSWEGGDYRSGEEWLVGPCSRCVCRDGQAECSTAECQPVVCSLENLVIQPGSCCPQCEANPCLSAGTQYQHGEHWQKNSCTTCVCERGQSHCHTLSCPPVTCEKGQTKVKRAGRCCDECAVAKGSCLYEGVVRYHGDMWKGAGCEFCSCERGQVLCQQAQCAQVTCPQGEVVVQVPGQCCPECSSSSGFCGRPQEEQRSRLPELLAGSERWSDGPCRECECREGRVTCYRPSCPSCPPGTLTVSREGRCCPECSHERCHEDCLVCSGSPEQCEVCRDSSALLLQGRCLLSCPPRYHSLGRGRGCAACQSSCATCESSTECSSCEGSSVLSSGQCVSTCEPGLFQDHTRCLRCHESCSECVGPGPEECVTCSSPALLLREGVCVSDCGPGFYMQRGICYACDPSCASCYPDNPKCVSCPPGFALHHAKCISDCPEGHYLESDSRCRACPGPCSSCSGPGGSQCTRCPHGRSLSGGRCVEACGEGLYPQDGACHSCHVSCRVCLGPGPSGCLACRKPEEALLPQDSAGGGGVCVSGCTARHYLDASHTCQECHTSCLQCTGGSAHNCTSCSAPFLLHDDQCVSGCPQGFHVQDNTCRACHPSCPSCSGPSQADCQACAPQSSLYSGYCRTHCPEGHYLGPAGSCHACSEGCQRCTADLQTRVGSVCLWCQVPRTLLLGDHCVSTCPPGRYVWHGACRRCHPSCEACSGEGPLSCTSCPAPMVLLPSGLCSASCPRGYYANGDRVCNACDPPCLSCEAAGACRSCRDPSQVLLFGECQDSCAQQYYLNTTTRACTECDWSCNSCRGPLVSDCVQCMEGLVLQEGMCSQACSPGFYQHGDTCLRCEEDCEQCDSPGVCERCRTPLMLRLRRCVEHCGRAFFLDASMQLCTPCAKDCVECEGEGLCKVCRYHTYLRDGRCVPDCGRGYYADKKTMTCYGNTHAPTLRVNGTLLVPLEGMVPLPPSLLSTQGPPGPLFLQLLQPPSSGRLVLVEGGGEGGGERLLAQDDSFSWDQLQGGAVRFSQDKDKPRSGEFTLRFADLQPSSSAQTVHVQAVSMQPPQVLSLRPLEVGVGQAAVLSQAVLQVQDPDNPQDVLVMVLTPPRHGRISRLHGERLHGERLRGERLRGERLRGERLHGERLHGEHPLGRFRLEDLSRERLQYVHQGSQPGNDSALLQVNDGHNYLNILLLVDITQKAAPPPRLVSLPQAWVRAGGQVRLGSRYLRAESQGAGQQDILYSIVSPGGSPSYGEVVLVPVPSDAPVEGWQPSAEDSTSTPTSSFTQQDVNEGRVWYRHHGPGPRPDTFLFQVSTEGSPDSLSDAQSFTVSVLAQTPGHPQLAPSCDLQITALEDHVTVITPAALSFLDTDSPSEKLLYNITKPLTPSHGVVEHRDKPYRAVRSFSQEDINQGRIQYRPPPAPAHLQELYQYSFIGLPESLNVYFTVSDGDHTSPELDFSIHLLANHQQPPVFLILDPLLEVSPGGTAALGGQQLAVSDADTSPDELQFELVEAPLYGTLFNTHLHTEMGSGDTFSFSDVTRGVLQYRHAGRSHDDDTITVSVSDGVSMVTGVVQVLVQGGGGGGPRRDPHARLSLEVEEKSSTVITPTHLAYTDDSSSSEQVWVQLVSVPMYGLLTLLLRGSPQELTDSSSFTMQDIQLQRIRYVTSFDTGNQPVTDIFHFVVFDADKNRLDNQMFTITITSKPSQPPVVTVRSGMKVQEGGRVQLSTNHILVSDVDTPRSELLVWMVSPPKYGHIETTHTGGSQGGARVITPEGPFSVEELTSDSIFYVQDAQQSAPQDSVTFYISDGSSQTEAFSILMDIQSQEDRQPVVSVSSVHVEENSGVVITNSSFHVLDHDTPDNEIVITITKKPSYGKLRRRQFYSQPLLAGRVLPQGASFSYQDVLDHLLVYTPDTATGGSDQLGFSLTDGVHTETGTLEFTMDLRRSEGPRMTINRGLQLASGSSSKITEQNLRGTDMDSDNLKLSYVLTQDPSAGRLLLGRSGHQEPISTSRTLRSFTQQDVNKGLLEYRHEKGEPGGSVSFRFDLVDPDGNKLLAQPFIISVLEDRLPPSVLVNKGLVLEENSVKKLTTQQLSSSDQDSEPSELLYRVTKQPALGRLEYVGNPGTGISSFTQADLASRGVQYVHTSEEEKHADEFSFTVSDGVNEVSQTFSITLRPLDDSLPLLRIPGMRVQEGVRKTITEFELKATDADTEEDSIIFTVVQAPRHGTIERTSSGQHYRQTSSFSMEDVYQNRVSYNHDGSNSLKDHFSFTVADGTNHFFMVEDDGKEVMTAAPQKFKIEILPVDDGTPRIVTNLGLQWLEYMDNKATNLISKKELLTMDPDTEDGQLVYQVTTEPKHGFLESKLKPGSPISTFTQADINLGLVRYVLRQEASQETMDLFRFLVKDSKPNVVRDNVFHIQWSLISFQHKSYNVSEKAGTVAVTVKRTGNLNQYAIVLCRTEQGSATAGLGARPGQLDYVEYAGQVQFDEREDTKVCTIIINDDQVFEGVESFQVELSLPAYALLGQVTRASVLINDTEDEPTLQFHKKTFHANESSGFIHVPVERTGDTSSTVSAVCYTVGQSAQGSSLQGLESGSDFQTRGMTRDSRLIFGPGISMSTCDVRLVDDSEYELSEEFELVLADASDNTRMGDITVATVVIDGPNDASTVSLGNATFTFSEDAGTIEIPVLRQGSDVSSLASVWCATRPSSPPSATPGVDYIPSSKKVEFRPGTTQETCSLTIVDDIQSPAIEGSESFIVFLSSPQGAVLLEPSQADVIITDSFQDIPSMQFEKTSYVVKERDSVLHIPVLRSGDLAVTSSVRCFTRTSSAMVMDDFQERRNADESRITFLKGEKVKNCTVHINDDSVFEPEEEFQVHLGTPLGEHWTGAMVGVSDIVTVTITNDEDAPSVQFEQASYQVREPPGPDGVEVLSIKVFRRGDQDRTSKVRCSTRDGSAQSGIDYNPKSRVLKFTPGMDHILFKVEILSNEDREWHESFSLVLGPDDPVEAVLGEITTATVTILDQEAAGSLILPATPIVVSLADYDSVQEVTKEGSKNTASPGYPLVCVTPCDPHYPGFPVTRQRCEEAGINQTSVHFSWEVAAPTDASGARSPFETVTDNTPFTSVNHMVLDSIYFSRRFHVRCVAQARDRAGHPGTPLRSNILTIGTDGSICHTPVTTGTARGFQAQSFIATLKYLDVKHKEHPNRIHISVQIPHQDGMLPLVSTMPLHNLHFLLSESIYRQQHVCSNLVTLKDLQGISEAGFLDDVSLDSISLGPGYDRPYQFNPSVREPRSLQLYKHLNLKNCIWTFDAYYDMTELIDVCGGSVTADFQVRDSAQSFLTVQVPLHVSYIYVTAPRGWASLEHHTEMEFSFFYDTVLWRTGIQTDSVLSARLQIIRIYIKDDGRLVIDFKTHAKFRGQFVPEHHTLPGHKSQLLAPDHLGGVEFHLQLLWSAQSFDSPYQLWRATSSYSRKDYSGEYTVFLLPCTAQPTQPWLDPGDKPLSCTAHAPEKFLVPIAFQQTNRPVPVVYSLNTEFQLCNNEKIFMLDPASADMSVAELDYKGAFSMGQTLYGRVLWNPEQNLNAAYKLQLEKVYLCTGRDGYVPFFDPTGTLYNEGPQYGCIQPNKHLKHRFLLLDRKQPDVCDRYFHDVPFEANFASDVPDLQAMTGMPGVDGFTLKVDALYKVEAGHQWYLQVIYVIGPESISGPRIQRSLSYQLARVHGNTGAHGNGRPRRDLVDRSGRLTLDESLIYDNEGDQVKNGTNMKTLRLEVEASATFNPQLGSSVGGGIAAVTLLVLVLLAFCLLFRKCRRSGRKKKSAPKMAEEYPLNTKVEVCLEKCLEKNFSTKHCTVRNINILNRTQDISGKVNGKVNAGVKVKQVNLEVKLQNNLNDGTEV
ncbi:extracellular matrix protein FRAS1 isoform X2 [Hypomesus transpacificus]|uniref:extracellular matrix protein FRAS1 isoform X2 n=1 Tax=Hypomesus transpacificus TaxID=137520 RepID=UPI001F082B42|nr:extracellular matrix protein FRAS1 isoform X2 [Hypomesus transpacificus]